MDDLVPLMLVVLVLAMLFGLVTFVAQVQPAKVLVAAAARNCARAGVETLAAGRGLHQATATAVETALSGTAIDGDGLAVQVHTENVWGRGQVFVCETGYNVEVGDLPLVGWFYPADHVPLRAKVSVWIEPYKARWE
jgi:hypothetical protein